jgi:hypothetical protein
MAGKDRYESTGGRQRRARAALACVAAMVSMAQAPVPSGSPSISPSDPSDVADHTGFPGVPIDFFDEFSWQMFLTMVWPADPARRGEPDTSRPLDAPGPLVFETFRSNWETFQPGGLAPPEFDRDASITPCPGTQLPPGAFVIGAFPHGDEFLQADSGSFAGPLLAQNRTWTRYTTGYNRLQYDHIRANGLYVHSDTVHIRFPDSSTVVKSAWMDLTDMPEDRRSRYHTRMAWVMDPGGSVCVERLVGLVGLHIVKRTPSRPQWIWTSFEHVDNVPDDGPARPWAYNGGDGVAMPDTNPHTDATSTVPNPFNVTRVRPIHEATGATNRRYRDALAARGSVWQNYQLVLTQWPRRPNTPSDTGRPPNTFPGTAPGQSFDRTAFANTAMETFDQASISKGCMACHNVVRGSTDFIWSVFTHAARPGQHIATAASVGQSPEIRELRQLMTTNERENRRARRERR